MSTTASDQINRALRLLGVLAEGETPSNATSQDALLALNQMLDSWNTERLSVFCTQDQAVTWPASTASGTLGPSGTLGNNLIRPVKLDDATYFMDTGTGVSFGIRLINQEQYDGVAVKTITSTYPEVLFYNPTYPNGTVTLFPVPTGAIQFHFISVLELTQPALLTTALMLPDGYLRAFAYNLALEIAPEFGVEPSPTIKSIAIASKRDIKRINDPEDVMAMPYQLIATHKRYNIYSGNF
ncbi:hypothetical protein KGP36_04060 [Patescibacteria group bacterium]|nr:hypothetical protein [Patescibacteria group bacterium]